jgi:hypothetical protein
MPSDGFECVDLYPYEKTRTLNPLVTLINHNYLQPSDATKDIGVQVDINDIHPPLEATLDSVQVHSHEDIHVYEEIQPFSPPSEATLDTVKVDIHSPEEINVYQEIQPLNPPLLPEQGPML